MYMEILRAALGVSFFVAVAWALSSDRERFPWRIVIGGVGAQIALGLMILKTDWGFAFFRLLSDGFVRLLESSRVAGEIVFGRMGAGDPDTDVGYVFAFAGNGLLAIIFFSALLAVLYHLGVMQALIWALARMMTWAFRVSGAESLAMAANVFAGQTEAPLVVRPYLSKMTRSELNALMTGGFATVAGSVLAVYASVVGPANVHHLLTASVMSAPAAFVIAKVLVPESGVAETAGHVPFRVERQHHNVLEAAAAGTSDGLKLWLNVIAMLIAFAALVHLLNWPLGALGVAAFGMDEGELSVQSLLGWVFAPVAWLIGVAWEDCRRFGTLLGIKIAVNEVIAFLEMGKTAVAAAAAETPQAADAVAGPAAGLDPIGEQATTLGFTHARSAQMAFYALCGFANFASIGIQIGGIASLVPERRTDLAKLALKAMIGGACASWMTASIAGGML